MKTHRTTLFFILCLFFFKFSFSQQATDLVGDWKITKVELSPGKNQVNKEKLRMVTQIFLKSTFHFKENNLFSFNSPDKDLATKDAIWKFDSDKKYIAVTERVSIGSPGKLMGITLKVTNEKYIFLMDETELILSVEKK